ncbi:hypothetical protein AC578_5368 [Pseudocercospora eumusae]|uniref:Uncharacterized protein n=1 Tax=Pseudocercospora eumusae TaxID=321146 RepID=A0A139HKB5_9PEZI|nr:hypothetical protein AC578_5368 [Pseudocercospora eumusae]
MRPPRGLGIGRRPAARRVLAPGLCFPQSYFHQAEEAPIRYHQELGRLYQDSRKYIFYCSDPQRRIAQISAAMNAVYCLPLAILGWLTRAETGESCETRRRTFCNASNFLSLLALQAALQDLGQTFSGRAIMKTGVIIGCQSKGNWSSQLSSMTLLLHL